MRSQDKYEAYRDQCVRHDKTTNGCSDTNNPTSKLEVNGCKQTTCPHHPFTITKVEAPVVFFGVPSPN